MEKYLPTKEFYKSLGKHVSQKSDAEIDSFLSRNKVRLIENWAKISEHIKKEGIDPTTITKKETIVYNPYSQSVMQAMVIVYEYKGKIYDDVGIIVKEQKDKTFLLEIPNPLRAFAMTDTSLANSSQAKVALELAKPEFERSLQRQVQNLAGFASNGSRAEFGAFVIYHGEDENRNWKSPVNMSDSVESKMSTALMLEVKQAMSDCSNYSFDKIKSEKESEGYWIVQPIKCGQKIIRFAFLKVRDKLLLGDIDVEELN